MRIWLDMDGTIANLYVGEWLNDIRHENTRPYENAERLVDEQILLDLQNAGHQFGIISWTAKFGTTEYNKAVRRAKVEWLKRNYPQINFEHIHIVKYGTPKYRFMMNNNDILVDDELQNRVAWKGLAVEPFKMPFLY